MPSELSAYVRYVVGFDALAYPDSAEASCASHASRPACHRLRDQALTRLLQERVVLDYASAHHIRLNRTEQRAIRTEIVRLDGPQAPTRKLFQNGTVSRGFVHSILERQMLVQKVQARVAGQQAAKGPAFKLRRIRLPLPSGLTRARMEAQVSSIRRGGPLPTGAEDRTEWIAQFRVPAEIRKALARARRGAYVGPFQHKGTLLLVQLLGQGKHAFGAPARRKLTSEIFSRWLHDSLLQAHPRCLTPQHRLMPCPPRIMKAA
jgi:hypothetical protein